MTRKLYRVTKESKPSTEQVHWARSQSTTHWIKAQNGGYRARELPAFFAGSVGMKSITHRMLTEKQATFLRLQGAKVVEMTDDMVEETAIKVFKNRNGNYEKST